MGRLWAAVAFGVLIASLALPSTAQTGCNSDTEGLTPIMDMGRSEYLGLDGGLYGGGSNEIPADHLELGLEFAGQIQPLDAQGLSSPSQGRIVILALGVSNTLQEFNSFIDLAGRSSEINPAVALVNGALGGAELEVWGQSRPWDEAMRTIHGAGISERQVQVVWIKLPTKARGTPDLTNNSAEREMLASVVRELPRYFPNTRLAFISSRSYGGFGGKTGEPAAYQNGFTVRETIGGQIAGTGNLNPDADLGPVVAPWLAWGPYLWANGTSPRSDGLAYECGDFESDGIHPAQGAEQKIGELLLEHFGSHPTTSFWFLDTNSNDWGPTSGVDATVTTATTPDFVPETTSDDGVSNGQAEGPAPAPSIRLPWILAGVAALAVGLGAIRSLRRRR